MRTLGEFFCHHISVTAFIDRIKRSLKNTRVSNLLQIEFPIIQGGMLWLANAGLASAVSNTGGLGVVSPFAGMAEDGDAIKNFQKEIRRRVRRVVSRWCVRITCKILISSVLE
ncbi:MAG: nitronate monooxygenase [Deltaproteobacteria bacterium]|nr:nitronate monooxygenase [Deltaproteobacteria bacterium]MBW1854903.1 nitronate monooxygenase [Deltaproteobacteria bacterium]